jgi:hypothetical protein
VIPATLTQLQRWAYSDSDKAPRQPSGSMAKINDPATWSSLADVKGLGIGAALAVTPDAGLVVVDLDGCIDENGQVHLGAQKIVAMLDSYTEVSLSGRGLHVVMRGAKPPVQKPWTKIALDGFVVEMFDAHFVTLTGNHLPGTPDDVQDRQQQITEVYFHVAELAGRPTAAVDSGGFPAPRTPYMPDDTITDLIKKSKQGPKFIELMTALPETFDDASKADAQLFGILAFYTQDPEQLVRIAAKSALAERVKNGQVKWDREDYLDRTLHLVLDNREPKDCYSGGALQKLELVALDTISMKPVPWLWPGHLPLGATTLLVGDPGEGKTLSGCDLLARITVGAPWPDGSKNSYGPRNVIVLSAEDDNGYTLKPRIVAAGGDPARVYVVPADRVSKLSLEADIERLKTVVDEIKPLALLLDPLSAYLPGIDTNTDAKVRSALLTFVALLADKRVSAIAVMHMSKNIERSAMQRVLGSTAFTALSRSTFMISRDPDAPEDDAGRRLFLPVKFNLGPRPEGRVFRIVGKTVSGDGTELEAPVAEWGETVRAQPDDVLRQLQRSGTNRHELHDAMRAAVAEGPITVKDMKDRLAHFGKADRTLREHRDKLGITTERDPADPMGGEFYCIPPKWAGLAAWRTARMALRTPPVVADVVADFSGTASTATTATTETPHT